MFTFIFKTKDFFELQSQLSEIKEKSIELANNLLVYELDLVDLDLLYYPLYKKHIQEETSEAIFSYLSNLINSKTVECIPYIIDDFTFKIDIVVDKDNTIYGLSNGSFHQFELLESIAEFCDLDISELGIDKTNCFTFNLVKGNDLDKNIGNRLLEKYKEKMKENYKNNNHCRFKFNGGKGAILCSTCSKIIFEGNKIPKDINDDVPVFCSDFCKSEFYKYN